MTKHLVDIDEVALAAARAELQTTTIRDTVNQALHRAGGARAQEIVSSLDVLAAAKLEDREAAWG